MRVPDLASFEGLLDDSRVGLLADKLRSEFGQARLDQTDLVTFIQPAREVSRMTEAGLSVPGWVPEMAVFALISPNPRRQGSKLMTHATAALTDFREAEQEGFHFVGMRDPAHKIFAALAKVHLKQLDDLRAMVFTPNFRPN